MDRVYTRTAIAKEVSHMPTVDTRTFQSYDLRGWVHDGRIGSDGSPDGVGGVRKVDYDYL